MNERSPLITQVSWGRMTVERLGEGKDFKLYPGGGSAWDWAETGTRHSPGIQPADLTELIEHGNHVIVLSRGLERRLETCPEAIEMLNDLGLEYYVDETRAAVERYNPLAGTTAVGGLFHSTC